MDPANYGGVKGKLPSSVLYGEVIKQICVEMTERSRTCTNCLVNAFISRKVPKRAKRAKKKETRRAATMKTTRKLRKPTARERPTRWRS